jgi:predicted nuclease of predicted toxin-antitoxin system
MSLKIVIDMSLSPDWVDIFQAQGWTAAHWSQVGDARAKDEEIFRWARDNGHIIFTHDLDFGTMLALSHARGPSVFQVRAQDVLPNALQRVVVTAMKQHETDLTSGSLVVVDAARSRVRILPI